MRRIYACPICKSERISFIFNSKNTGQGPHKEFSTDSCRDCKALFLNPMPEIKELEEYYPSGEYYSLKKVDRSSLKHFIRSRSYSLYKRSPMLYSFLKFFLPQIRRIDYVRGGRLLDIGSGSGQFLFDIYGLDMEKIGVEPGYFDKGLEKEGILIKRSTLDQANFKSKYFDVVTMNHVFEHLDNPLQVLKEVHRIMKDGGTFIIAVPNSNSWAYKIFKNNWFALDPPRHLINYSTKNLVSILKLNGFAIKKVIYNARTSQFTDSIQKLYGNNYFLKGILIAPIYPITLVSNILRKGDQIEIVCKKPIHNR